MCVWGGPDSCSDLRFIIIMSSKCYTDCKLVILLCDLQATLVMEDVPALPGANLSPAKARQSMVMEARRSMLLSSRRPGFGGSGKGIAAGDSRKSMVIGERAASTVFLG